MRSLEIMLDLYGVYTMRESRSCALPDACEYDHALAEGRVGKP